MLTVGAGMGESDGLDRLEESSIKRPGRLPTFSPLISQTNNTISQPPHRHRHHQANKHTCSPASGFCTYTLQRSQHVKTTTYIMGPSTVS
jgi:hypothetical protein